MNSAVRAKALYLSAVSDLEKIVKKVDEQPDTLSEGLTEAYRVEQDLESELKQIRKSVFT